MQCVDIHQFLGTPLVWTLRNSSQSVALSSVKDCCTCNNSASKLKAQHSVLGIVSEPFNASSGTHIIDEASHCGTTSGLPNLLHGVAEKGCPQTLLPIGHCHQHAHIVFWSVWKHSREYGKPQEYCLAMKQNDLILGSIVLDFGLGLKHLLVIINGRDRFQILQMLQFVA